MSSDILTFEEAVEYSKIAKKIGYKIAVVRCLKKTEMEEWKKNNQNAKIGSE